MKKSLISLLFILVAVTALDSQARGCGQGGIQGQGLEQSSKQGSFNESGDMQRDRMRQQTHDQNQERAQQQQREILAAFIN
ncbi:hypothetical protein [Methylobacter sp. S3L5C]|uniref:hypothetical protein n=1 Tax=Methylobacter sp. S3L5C TaxID=2839024 RepID=UPI001FAB612D|nr:hypothetical protein [Methylobacter sp. S3L5C]UOA08659.1 hypothetical protein KKZ03_21130 [Methylobacter sp. S3L5C]